MPVHPRIRTPSQPILTYGLVGMLLAGCMGASDPVREDSRAHELIAAEAQMQSWGGASVVATIEGRGQFDSPGLPCIDLDTVSDSDNFTLRYVATSSAGMGCAGSAHDTVILTYVDQVLYISDPARGDEPLPLPCNEWYTSHAISSELGHTIENAHNPTMGSLIAAATSIEGDDPFTIAIDLDVLPWIARHSVPSDANADDYSVTAVVSLDRRDVIDTVVYDVDRGRSDGLVVTAQYDLPTRTPIAPAAVCVSEGETLTSLDQVENYLP